jgi:CubicO group peptidase (beta-lactamase class C family)
MTNVQGTVPEKYESVRQTLAASIKGGGDIGASFCATRNGEIVVDIWGGHADAARTRPWEKDTIVNVYSTTKTMTALTVLKKKEV